MSSVFDLLNEWMTNRSWWFSASKEIDTYLHDKFGHLFDSCDSSMDPTDFPRMLLGRIILHDQLIRHCVRDEPANHIVAYHLQLALKLTSFVLDNFNAFLDVYSVQEWSFILLPLRHTQQFENIVRASSVAWNLTRIHRDTDSQNILKYFLKATYERMPTSQDRFIRLHTVPDIASPDTNLVARYHHLFDVQNITTAADLDEVVLDTIIGNAIGNSLDASNFIVSLSGGVDSMLLLHGLIKYRDAHQNKAIVICAVHINYTNKPSAHEEEEFLAEWCRYRCVPLITRRIEEIQREPCMSLGLRDTYETYTRKVRYNTYKAAWARFDRCRDKSPVVLLGHNRDDCIENIITNMTYQTKHQNMKGMDMSGVVDDVVFVRPFLSLPKSSIRSLARRHGVPHFHDSTPSWSQRGRIRDIVVPSLNEWDRRSIDGLLAMSDTMKELYACMEAMVDDLVENTHDGVMHIQLNALKKLNRTAWKMYFTKLTFLHISQSSIESMMNMMHQWCNFARREPRTFMLNKKVKATVKALDTDGLCCLTTTIM